jgi:hypothetical protein
LSVIVRVPFCVAAFVGEKVISTVHVPPAGLIVVQLFWIEKSPVTVAFETVSAMLPMSKMVTGCGVLDVPTACAGKINSAGFSAAAGASVGEILRMNASELTHWGLREHVPAPGTACNALNIGNGGGGGGPVPLHATPAT